jgi:hypothetical protein
MRVVCYDISYELALDLICINQQYEFVKNKIIQKMDMLKVR